MSLMEGFDKDHTSYSTYSFSDKVLLDIAAVACVALEMTCNKYLRSTLPVEGSLCDRFSVLRQLLKNDQLHIP